MTAQQPNTPDIATVDSAAARQTCDWQASLDQPENHTPERAQPEHGEAQSCAPRQPAQVEIRVDGNVIHTFLAEQINTHEDRGTLTLNAARWSPAGVTIPDNPFLSERRELNVSVEVAGKLYPLSGTGFVHPDPNPEPDPLDRATSRIGSLMRSIDGIVQRGSCPECRAGVHACTQSACYCTDPHRCGWPNITTTKGTN